MTPNRRLLLILAANPVMTLALAWKSLGAAAESFHYGRTEKRIQRRRDAVR